MKEREIYSINSDHGIIIIINDKQYLYMFNTLTTSLTEKSVNELFSSKKRDIPYMPFKKLSRLNLDDLTYIGMLDETLFLSVFPKPKFQKFETSNAVIYNVNYLELQRLRDFLEKNGTLTATDEDLEKAWMKYSNEKFFTNWVDMDGYNLKRFLQCSHRYL